MANNDLVQINIDPGRITELIHCIAELSESIQPHIDLRLYGILETKDGRTEEQNAYEWMYENYEMVSCTSRTICGIAGLVSDALANLDIEITAKQ